ncbi:MAG: hypothetical protein JO144_04100, partial [Actinobacteria bacterium]|nr:hypothetical protein [Actinomycetota bacterium]
MTTHALPVRARPGRSRTARVRTRPYYSPAEIARLLGTFPPTEEQAAVIAAPLEPAVVIAG